MSVSSTNTMTLLVHLEHLDGACGRQRITLFGRMLVERYSWTEPVRLGPGVQLDRGEFHAGGLRRGAIVGGVTGVVLQVADVPVDVALRALAESPLAVRLADGSLVDRPALFVEQDRLRRRLSAVEALLALEDA